MVSLSNQLKIIHPTVMLKHRLSFLIYLISFSVAFPLLGEAQTLPYQNPNLSARERAQDLCSRLTLEQTAL